MALRATALTGMEASRKASFNIPEGRKSVLVILGSLVGGTGLNG